MARIELPEVLVMEILSKLPVKSLARFNCVCKYWCSSFQIPHFIFKHYHNNIKNNNLNLLLRRHDGNTFQPYLSQLSNEKDKKNLVKQNIHLPFFKNAIPSVYGVCHGLLCLQELSTDKAALWNPSTREFKILPPSSIQRPPYLSPMEGNLALYGVSFDHAALGFDSKTNDYKVIRFVSFIYYHSPFVTRTFVNIEEEQRYAYPHYEFQVELYSKKKILPFPRWPAPATGGGRRSTGDRPPLAGFPFPPPFSLLSPFFFFSVIVCLLEGTGMSFDLWVTREGVWTKQFSIESISGVVHPLGFGKNGELFLRDTNNEIVLFDLSTQELKELEINTYLDHFRESISLHAYVESLVRINGIQEHEEHIIRQLAGDASNKY
ncbi:hypothetical protein ES319_A10G250300v1 [Gossypium barbadense]|uniref:F-box domain-containing protein n=1 Tax=Gossypium barbadense TaxID=3634 RepID=A0A5J5U8C4_GOSBA|nr:hypothetical protein ES319_A10G250300v1 [Gossypium barbadense]